VSQHPDPHRLDELIRGWGEMIGKVAGLAAGRLAEGYLVVDTA